VADIDGVREACARFRAAIEADQDLPSPMAGFPSGACGDTSELLGQYLQDCGFGTWMYVMGFRDSDSWTHAWLEADGVIVDITSDQFDDVTSAVVVTHDRQWHDREFERVSLPRPANMSFFSECSNEAEMNRLYERLRAAADSA
jgi:hypothetical protein